MKALRPSSVSTLTACFAMALLTLAAASSSTAQVELDGRWVNGVSEPWWFREEAASKEEIAAAQAIWGRIGEERRAAARDEWAGDYFSGSETHGRYLRWSPQGGFVLLHVNKCAAMVEGFFYGKAVVTPSLFRFVPAKETRPVGTHRHGSPRTETNFVPVKFRGDLLLVPEGEFGDFGDFVAGLGRYNYSEFRYFWETEFLTRFGPRDERQGAADGPPNASTDAGVLAVPPGYERFLKKPIGARIVAVGKSRVVRKYSYENPDRTGAYYERASLTFVTVNAGSARGVKSGMFFYVAAPDEGDRVRILRVGRRTSTGVVIRGLAEDERETFIDHAADRPVAHSKVAAGWRLTTSPF